MRVLITGAAGNLGRKLVPALLGSEWCSGVVAIDRSFAAAALPADLRVSLVATDLTAMTDDLRDAVSSVDAVVHLAAQNTYPDATWAESAASFDMTANLLSLAAAGGQRVVFASSNHVMGGYKDVDPPLAPGTLTTALPPRPGTRVATDPPGAPPSAYAGAKLLGERLCVTTAAASGVTAVALRVGWCQPGRNHPHTISAAGVPDATSTGQGADAERDLLWFRHMWLSDRDFVGLVLAAIRADAGRWPSRGIVVNAMSNNVGMPWDLGPTRDLLGYAPQDDVWAALETA